MKFVRKHWAIIIFLCVLNIVLFLRLLNIREMPESPMKGWLATIIPVLMIFLTVAAAAFYYLTEKLLKMSQKELNSSGKEENEL